MSAQSETYELLSRLSKVAPAISFADANILRRAQLTLHRWAELECGDGNDHSSWGIERDEKTGKPFMHIYPHTGTDLRYPVPDREAGAIRRIEEVCKRLGIEYFHQTDPRGCALYVGNALTDSTYTRGIACCI